MKLKPNALSLALLILLSPHASLLAAEPMDVDSAIEHALNANPTLTVERLRADALTVPEQWISNPELRYGTQEKGLNEAVFDHEIALRFALPQPRSLSGRHHYTSALEAQGDAAFADARFRLDVEIHHRYDQLAALAGEIDAAKAWVKALDAVVLATDEALEMGLVTALDKSLIHLDYLEAEGEVEALERDFNSQKARLAALIGLDSDFNPQLQALQMGEVEAPPAIETLVERAAAENAQLAGLRAQVKGAQAQLALSRGGALPWFNFMQLGADINRTDIYADDFRLNFAVGIDLPLTGNRAERAQVKANFDLAQAELSRAEYALEDDIEAAHRRLEEAIADLRDDRVLKGSELALSEAKKALDNGQISRQKWASIQAQNAQFHRRQAGLWSQYYQAHAQWVLALGFRP